MLMVTVYLAVLLYQYLRIGGNGRSLAGMVMNSVDWEKLMCICMINT